VGKPELFQRRMAGKQEMNTAMKIGKLVGISKMNKNWSMKSINLRGLCNKGNLTTWFSH
jgi:hypothetical protein